MEFNLTEDLNLKFRDNVNWTLLSKIWLKLSDNIDGKILDNIMNDLMYELWSNIKSNIFIR